MKRYQSGRAALLMLGLLSCMYANGGQKCENEEDVVNLLKEISEVYATALKAKNDEKIVTPILEACKKNIRKIPESSDYVGEKLYFSAGILLKLNDDIVDKLDADVKDKKITKQSGADKKEKLKKIADALVEIQNGTNFVPVCISERDFEEFRKESILYAEDIISHFDGQQYINRKKSFANYYNACMKNAYSISPEFKNKLNLELVRAQAVVESKMNELLVESSDKNDAFKKSLELRNLSNDLNTLKDISLQDMKLDRGWNDRSMTQFYLGVEGTSVKEVNAKSTARLGFMYYSQNNARLIDIYKDSNKGCTDKKDSSSWFNGMVGCGNHWFINVLVSSSAESSEQNVASDTDVTQAIEVETAYFMPLSAVKHPEENSITVSGPIISLAFKKIDKDNAGMTRRHYIGYRYANSPESYADFLFGETTGVEGVRGEIRGQIPVSRLIGGRIFAGLAVNLGIKDSPNKDNDSIKLYLTWSATFADIFTSSPKPSEVKK
ncbi:MAG: hypothetical protein OEZ39_02605 [Gammaproteobacteria bacterium]|nr:hypothetical protein [Gammaproteobacteria bacterium]MDH5650746.1 hypothetical protein [Gammaproteobacteria bacterium]